MSNGSDTSPPPPPNGSDKLDIQVINNGVKLLGEALVPGASLMLEKHIGAGLLLGGLGVLGSAALGSTFGPLGYILARYGASAVSFSQSLQEPPDGSLKILDDAKKVLTEASRAMRENSAVMREAVTTAMRAPPAFSPPARPAADTVDFALALQRINERLDEIERSVREVRPVASARRGRARGAAA